MSRYEMVPYSTQRRYYIRFNGHRIAHLMTYRRARQICDLLNAERDRKRSHPEFVKLAETLLAGES